MVTAEIDDIDGARPRDDRAEDGRVWEHLEGLEGEFNLLKSEVKQTLIDLREFVMKGSATRVTSVLDAPKRPPQGRIIALEDQASPAPQEPTTQPANGQIIVPEDQASPPPRETTTQPANGQIIVPEDQASPPPQEPTTQPANGQIIVPEDQASPPPQKPTTQPLIAPQSDHNGLASLVSSAEPGTPISLPIPANPDTASPSAKIDPRSGYSMDPVKMGHIFRWLVTVARVGISPRQLKPFLQAYEGSGHLTPVMASLTNTSLEELENAMGKIEQSYSPAEYSQCLLELHEIICNPEYAPKPDPQVQT